MLISAWCGCVVIEASRTQAQQAVRDKKTRRHKFAHIRTQITSHQKTTTRTHTVAATPKDETQKTNCQRGQKLVRTEDEDELAQQLVKKTKTNEECAPGTS